MNAAQFRQYIIKPTLANLMPSYGTQFAEDLLISTCAQETHLAEYVAQVGGPAVNIYQFELFTFNDLWNNFIAKLQRWDTAILSCSADPDWNAAQALDVSIYNLRFATLCARLNYYRVPAPLPIVTTLDNLWNYYKPYWNSYLGAATKEQFAQNIKTYTDIKI